LNLALLSQNTKQKASKSSVWPLTVYAPLDQLVTKEKMLAKKRLCLRSVPQDGNEFYVMASIVLYGVHDKHEEIRRRLWDVFCRAVLEEPLDAILDRTGSSSKPLDIEHPWFGVWAQCYAPLHHERDLTKTRPILESAVRKYARIGTMGPFALVCALLTRVHGTGIVFYDAGQSLTDVLVRDGQILDNDEWAPTRVWDPPPETLQPVPYMHLLQRRGALQLLVEVAPAATTADGLDTGDIRNRIPTEPVTGLPLKLRTDASFEPASSAFVEANADYKLGVYDSQSRKCNVAGHFVAPITGFNPKASTLHFMRIDTALRKDHLIFTVQPCTEQARCTPLYIFACRTVRSQTVAECIGHWPVDLCWPRISLRNQDNTILLVPGAANPDVAAQCVTHQWGCVAYTGRSEMK